MIAPLWLGPASELLAAVTLISLCSFTIRGGISYSFYENLLIVYDSLIKNESCIHIKKKTTGSISYNDKDAF